MDSADNKAAADAKFDAFVSYSRHDRDFVDRLCRTLGRYTPPQGLRSRPGRLRVFCDTQDIQGAEYFSAIDSHLQSAAKLIVVCSPAAAASRWVDDEIERFVRQHGAAHVIPVLYRGLPSNEARPDQAEQRAFPPALERALQMPLAADFRGFDASRDKIDGESYRPAWMLLLSNLLNVSRSEVEQRELKRRRAVRRTWAIGLSTVFAALSALTIWALFEGERALARQLTAQASIRGGMELSQVERRVLLAREAVLRHERLGETSIDADTALRDALAHAPRRRLALPPSTARRIAFSADGEHLIVGEGNGLMVYSLSTQSEVHRLALEHPLQRLSASPDARFVAAIDDSGALHLWSWPELTPVEAAPPEVEAAPLQCFAFSEEGETIVALRIAADDARTIQLLRWRPGTATLRQTASVRLHAPVRPPAREDRCLFASDPVGSVFHAIGGLLEADRAETEGPERIAFSWSLDTATLDGFTPLGPTNEPIAHWRAVVDLAFDQNARPVLANEGGGIQRPLGSGAATVAEIRGKSPVILARNGAWGLRLEPLEDPYVPLLKPTRIDIVATGNNVVMRSLADHAGLADFTPDAETIATVSAQRIRVWDRRDGRERLRLHATAPVAGLLFDATSRQVALRGSDGSLEVFAIGAADETTRFAAGRRATLIDAAARPVVVSGRRLLWPAAAGRLPTVFELQGYAQRLTASPDGRFLVVGISPEEPMIKIGEPATMQLLLIATPDSGKPSLRYRGEWGEHRFDRAAIRLLVAGRDGNVRLIDTADGRVRWTRGVARMSEPPAAALTGWHAPLAMADDGNVSAVPSKEGLLLLIENDGGKVLRTERISSDAFALSSDGKLLARSGAGSRLQAVRVADGSIVAEFDGSEAGSLRELMFSPGGALLLGIGGTSFSTFMSGRHFAEEHAIAWSLADGTRVARVPESTQALADYQQKIGPRGDDAQQLTSLVWNSYSKEFAGTLYPSLLAYYTVPSDEVRGRLAVWRLEDTGIVETYRGAAEDTATTDQFAATGSIIVRGEDRVQRSVDLRRRSVVAAACATVTRPLTLGEQRAALGSGLRRPLDCPGLR